MSIFNIVFISVMFLNKNNLKIKNAKETGEFFLLDFIEIS
tara:strand:- start:442 stop:561 length:120 start_codon:yes stop_codon:yes gene_type:complete